MSVQDVVDGEFQANEIKCINEARKRDIENNSVEKDAEVPVRLKFESEKDDDSKMDEDEEDKEQTLSFKLPHLNNRRGTYKISILS